MGNVETILELWLCYLPVNETPCDYSYYTRRLWKFEGMCIIFYKYIEIKVQQIPWMNAAQLNTHGNYNNN